MEQRAVEDRREGDDVEQEGRGAREKDTAETVTPAPVEGLGHEARQGREEHCGGGSLPPISRPPALVRFVPEGLKGSGSPSPPSCFRSNPGARFRSPAIRTGSTKME